MLKKTLLAAAVVAMTLPSLVFAADAVEAPLQLSAGMELNYDEGLSTKEFGRLYFTEGPFTLIAALSMNGDGKYAPAEASVPGGEFYGQYFMMDEGGLEFASGNLSLKAGRFPHFDTIDSPYSLFVNSLGHSALLGQVRYDNGRFAYESRWVGLNHNSSISTKAWDEFWNAYSPSSDGFPERGANIKTYSMTYGRLRFGLQDAAVYTGKYFDPEYFLSPVPGYFIQYVRGTSGRPWATNENDNSIIGFFVNWKEPERSEYYFQFLMDDFNVPILSDSAFPNQLAWAFGGKWSTRFGKIGIHHAGALKYTFMPNTSTDGNASSMAYGYTYYPDTSYLHGSDLYEISVEDNLLGYKHGENNAALQIDYQNRFAGFDLGASVEFMVAGANSPANPWHDAGYHSNEGTKWLDDAVLQKSVEFSFKVGRDFGALKAYASLNLGYIWNVLKLSDVDTSADRYDRSLIDQHVMIWKPSADNKAILACTLGARYVFGLK